jgi:MoaA/NifB/PqqE/SkfB family radical SAM enzyme/class 3 adenylate cyclase
MTDYKNDEWVIMFVDMVGSTELKYRVDHEIVKKIIMQLFTIINESSSDNQKSDIKFTGDGAMVMFSKLPEGCQRAINSAESIIQKIDCLNLEFQAGYPEINIRVGIATGRCVNLGAASGRVELSGRAADLAARLCSEADSNGILVDEVIKENSKLPDYRFVQCKRRLLLKGIPLDTTAVEKYYHFQPYRLYRQIKDKSFSNGLLAVYPTRKHLIEDFSPLRFIYLATQDSYITLAGRTLYTWTNFKTEMLWAVKKKNIKFRFLICNKSLSNHLEDDQRDEISRHWPEANLFFKDLATRDKEHFSFHVTDQLILDGILCAWITPLPDIDQTNPKTLVTVQDINAAAGDNKASILLACTCKKNDEKGEELCMAHGLLRRTLSLFNNADNISVNKLSESKLESIIGSFTDGLSLRNNCPSQYVKKAIEYFPMIEEGALRKISPPLCVQIQISSTCSTSCVMCQHHSENRKSSNTDITFDKWKSVFRELGSFGVKTVIFSGGEPLMRPHIDKLIRSAHKQGLKIGLLTNGTMVNGNIKNDRESIINAIIDCVAWVAVSIDGTIAVDKKIRHISNDSVDREKNLRQFCKDISKMKDKISATVTLQMLNADISFKDACEYINKDLGIAKINFKFATGAIKALNTQPNYLLNETQTDTLSNTLWTDPLTLNDNNNLDYLRRCFAEEVFCAKDISEGVPVRSFYDNHNNLRCYTPFMFSLIDSDGCVYPCCHLYRDNHGVDKSAIQDRQKQKLGCVKNTSFEEIWNGDKYVSFRNATSIINLTNREFIACGECTRHYRHNWFLSELYDAYQGTFAELKKDVNKYVKRKGIKKCPIWF